MNWGLRRSQRRTDRGKSLKENREREDDETRTKQTRKKKSGTAKRCLRALKSNDFDSPLSNRNFIITTISRF